MIGAPECARRLGLGWTLGLSSLVSAAANLGLLLALIWPPLLVLVAVRGLSGSQALIFNVNHISLRQSITPLHLQGRVSATIRSIVWGVVPIGYGAGGLLGNRLGPAATVAVGGCVGLLGCLWMLVRPTLDLGAGPAGGGDGQLEARELPG